MDVRMSGVRSTKGPSEQQQSAASLSLSIVDARQLSLNASSFAASDNILVVVEIAIQQICKTAVIWMFCELLQTLHSDGSPGGGDQLAVEEIRNVQVGLDHVNKRIHFHTSFAYSITIGFTARCSHGCIY